jgi:hypothetical protein
MGVEVDPGWLVTARVCLSRQGLGVNQQGLGGLGISAAGMGAGLDELIARPKPGPRTRTRRR